MNEFVSCAPPTGEDASPARPEDACRTTHPHVQRRDAETRRNQTPIALGAFAPLVESHLRGPPVLPDPRTPAARHTHTFNAETPRHGGTKRLSFSAPLRSLRRIPPSRAAVLTTSVRHRIEPVGAERMAPRQPHEAQPTAPQHPVPRDGFGHVIGAGRGEPARAGEQGRNQDLVCTEQQQDTSGGHTVKPRDRAPWGRGGGPSRGF